MESIFGLIEMMAKWVWSFSVGKYIVTFTLTSMIIWLTVILFESPKMTVERKERELRDAERIAERYKALRKEVK